MDIGQSLIEKFGAENVELQNNGFYHVKTTNQKISDEIIIPQKLDDETKILCYLPGANGSKEDAEPLREIMKKDDAPNCVVAIAHKSEDPNHILEQATKVVTSNNLKVTGVGVQGFSRGCFCAPVVLDEYLNEHPELAKSSFVLNISGSFSGMKKIYNKSLTDLDNLLKYQVPIFRQSDQRKPTNLKEAADAGFNILGLYGIQKASGKDDHLIQNVNALEAELGFYLLGVRDEIKPLKDGKNIYTLYKYKNNKAYDYDISELSKYVIKKLRNKGSLFDSLTNLTALSLKKRNDGSSKVISDLDFVIASMNSIRSDITSSSVLSTGEATGSGTISNLIANNINRYYADVGKALSKLEQETKSVASIGQATYDLDADLARQTDSFKIVGSIIDVDDLNNKNPKDKTNNA